MKKLTLTFLAGFFGGAAAMAIYTSFATRVHPSALDPTHPSAQNAAQPVGNAPDNGPEKSNRTERDTAKTPSPPLARLSELEASSPGLTDRLGLFLFNSDFKPVSDEWNLLGVPPEATEKLGRDLKNIFDDIRKTEATRFKVRRQTDNVTELSLPGMNREEARRRREQVESAFAAALGSDNSQGIANVFLRSQPAAALNGLDRVVSVRALTPEEAGPNSEDQYEFVTYVIREKNDLSKIEGDVAGYSYGSSIERSATIHAAWSPFFETPRR